MFRNYLKIALRSLTKQKIYTVINITGLSIGIAGCLLIVMFVRDELSYDKFHAKADRIHKIVLERKYPNHSTLYAVIPHSFADVMLTDFPEVEETLKIGGPYNAVVNYKNSRDELKQFEENFIISSDSNFFNVFSIAVVKGDPKKALIHNNDLVITETTAARYFGNEDPLGKTIRFFNQDFTVSAVCENVPNNSHLKFDFMAKINPGGNTNYTTFNSHVYLVLRPGTNATALEAKFPKMVDTYAAGEIERDLGKSWKDYKKEGNGYNYSLQSLKDIHLDPANIEFKMKPGGNIRYVYFLTATAILILVIACINFMNLATARSTERAREVGVRKTMGSHRSQLVSQFLIESLILVLLATVLAVVIVNLALPYFNDLTGKQLIYEFSGRLVFSLLALALMIGFLSGIYPAFVLSGFNPVVVMKGTFSGSAKGVWLRNVLVIFQFFISIVLIVATMVVAKQMLFMQNKSLGYDKDQILIIERLPTLSNKTAVETFIEELKQLPEVDEVASASALLGRQRDFAGAWWLSEGSSEVLTTKNIGISDDFAQAIGFEFVQGKGYSKDTNDSLSIILNEAAVKAMEIQDPIGKKLLQQRPQRDGTMLSTHYTIIGVIKDFNFQSLRDPVTPLTIQSIESFRGLPGYAYARVKGKNIPDVVKRIESKWKALAPDQLFKYTFLDQNLNANYESEKRAGQIFALFSGLAIIIACVGLFGLAAYTASMRTKEIGIRKVLGASVSNVVFLLSKDFTKLILIAFILAVPIAWYIMDNWLQGFAYRIELGVGIFLLAGVAALLISWLTVSYQSIKAAIVNPVKSLRSE